MTINELIAILSPSKIVIDGEIGNFEIKNISYNSRSKDHATVFFAYKGETYNSNNDAVEIYKKGKADFIISEIYLGENISHGVVDDGRVSLAKASEAFFDYPRKEYKAVAVTGTNGKTTTTYILDAIFKHFGHKTVRIGTTGIDVAGTAYHTDNTTPSSYDVYKYLWEGAGKNADFVAMEVSSHALAQGRLAGLKFDAAVFTNLTGDHLDFHKNMENYFFAKAKLFTDEMSNFKVINTEYEYGKRLAGIVKNNLITFSAKGNADIYPIRYQGTLEGSQCTLSVFGNVIDLNLPLIGKYNLENIMGAIGACVALNKDLDIREIVSGATSLEKVPGRLEKYAKNGITAFIDYAHTDDALKSILENLKALAKGRIITVFGAGGDRDKNKRPRMGKAAVTHSDIVIVTSDNPRSEEPMNIINDILEGIKDTEVKVIVEPDRETAIEMAVGECRENDLLLIAGKGHEDYQIIGNERRHFDDRVILKKYLERL